MALTEAGATVHCLDFPLDPDDTFKKTQDYVSKFSLDSKPRLEYKSVDITDQRTVRKVFDDIAGKGRLDVYIATGNVLYGDKSLNYSNEEFQKAMSDNVNGVLYTAQAVSQGNGDLLI